MYTLGTVYPRDKTRGTYPRKKRRIVIQSAVPGQTSKTVSQSLTLTDSIVYSHVVSKTVSDTLTVTQSLVSSYILGFTISDSLSLSQSLTTTAAVINEESISDTIALTQTIVDNFVLNITLSDTLSLTQTPTRLIVISKSISNTIYLTSTIVVTGAPILCFIRDQLYINDYFPSNFLRSIQANIDELELTDFVNTDNYLHLAMMQSIRIHDDQITRYIDGNIITYPAIIVVIPNKYVTIQCLGDIITLPPPIFGDSQRVISTIVPNRAINGTLYTHVKSTQRQRLNYKWSLKRQKSWELENYIRDHFADWHTMVDWKGYHWVVKITNMPIAFVATERGYECVGNKEVHTVDLEFEGYKI